MTKEQLKLLEKLEQFAPDKKNRKELIIGKNDPKNGDPDYWWCSYGKIHISGYYSLPYLLSALADQCVINGYAKLEENALLEN